MPLKAPLICLQVAAVVLELLQPPPASSLVDAAQLITAAPSAGGLAGWGCQVAAAGESSAILLTAPPHPD